MNELIERLTRTDREGEEAMHKKLVELKKEKEQKKFKLHDTGFTLLGKKVYDSEE